MANFKSNNDGTWFFFNKADENQGGVCLRELSIKELDSINAKTTTIKNKPHRGQMVEYRKQDSNKAFQLTMQYCIVDWKNVQLDGKDVECTEINKAKLMKVLDFVKFVTDCLDQLSETNEALEEAIKEKEEERVKNLDSTSPGNSKK